MAVRAELSERPELNRFTHAGREDHEHVEGDEHEVDLVEPRALQAARAEADRGRPPPAFLLSTPNIPSMVQKSQHAVHANENRGCSRV